MASVFDRIENRKAFPVDGCEGLFVREPLIGELSLSLSMPEARQNGTLFAFCVVDADGVPVMSRDEAETDEAFSIRASDAAKLMRSSVYAAVRKSIGTLLNPQAPEELAKN